MGHDRGLAAGGRVSPLDIPETARVVRQLYAQDYTQDTQYLIDGIRYVPMPSMAPSATRTCPTVATIADDEQSFATRTTQLSTGTAERFAWRLMPPLAVRRAVARLGQHHSAVTVGRLLDDVATRERDAIAIAARRPTTPAIVRQLTSRLRWINLPSVRAALVVNPCTPTRVSLVLRDLRERMPRDISSRGLSVTCIPRLRGIAAAANVHPRVRDLARRIESTRLRTI